MEHNHIEWPTERLDTKGRELSWSVNNIRHCPERLEQIKTELGLIAFEMWFRHQEGEFEFLEQAIDNKAVA